MGVLLQFVFDASFAGFLGQIEFLTEAEPRQLLRPPPGH